MLEVPAKYIAAVQPMSKAWLLSGWLMRCGSHVQLGGAVVLTSGCSLA